MSLLFPTILECTHNRFTVFSDDQDFILIEDVYIGGMSPYLVSQMATIADSHRRNKE